MEIEDEFSTIATLFWAAGVWKGRWKKRGSRRRGGSMSWKFRGGSR